MEINIFVSASRCYPSRWKEAFPSAIFVSEIPYDLPAGSVLWLHELLPQAPLAEGIRFIVMFDQPSEEKGLAVLARGASGYCNSNSAVELFHTIEMAVRTNDGLWVGEDLLNRLLSGLHSKAKVSGKQDQHPLLAELSDREKQIALRVGRGESNKEIMQALGIAERTIKAHLTGIFKLFGVRDRLQLAIMLNTPSEAKKSP